MSARPSTKGIKLERSQIIAARAVLKAGARGVENAAAEQAQALADLKASGATDARVRESAAVRLRQIRAVAESVYLDGRAAEVLALAAMRRHYKRITDEQAGGRRQS